MLLARTKNGSEVYMRIMRVSPHNNAYRQKGVGMSCSVLVRETSHMPEYGVCAANTTFAARVQSFYSSALTAYSGNTSAVCFLTGIRQPVCQHTCAMAACFCRVSCLNRCMLAVA